MGDQNSLTGETHHLITQFATFEERKSRNSADRKPAGKTRTVVHIDSRDFDNVALFFRDLIQYGGDHTARVAPGSRKMDQNRYRRLTDRLIKVGFVQVY